MSGEPEPEGTEELQKQDSNMWEFEDPADGEDAESPAANGQQEGVKVEDKDGDAAMGDAAGATAGAGTKHALIPAPAKAGEATQAAAPAQAPAQAQQGKQPGPKFGTGVNQGKAFEGRRQHRYFVLKSKSMFNVDQSVEKGIWATQVCHCTSSSIFSQLFHQVTTTCRRFGLCFLSHIYCAGTHHKTRRYALLQCNYMAYHCTVCQALQGAR